MKKELSELKVEYQIKCRESETLGKENQELKDAMAKQNLYGSKDSVEAKKMMDEIQKLRSLNKHRDDIIGQMETQNRSLRETETQLKLTQNDYELLHTQNKTLELRVKDLQEKCESAETKLAQLREKAMQVEKDKEQMAIEYQNKIELLQYKLLNKVESDSSFGGEDSLGGSKQFQELLGLCKSDLEEILNRLKSHVQNEATEDQLRRELLDQAKKISELKAQQEKQVYELTTENFKKADALHLKWEADKKQALAKLKEELALKTERIKELEKNEKKAMTDKEKCDSFARQIKEF